MKRLILLFSFVLASCCTTVPVKIDFPKAPAELKEPCPDLRLIEPDTTKLSEVVLVVAKNYEQYQECQVKVDSWSQWYDKQKKIFEQVK
jgi:hypothetical protein